MFDFPMQLAWIKPSLTNLRDKSLEHDECGSCRICWRRVVSLKGAKDVGSKMLASKAPEIILKRDESESWRRFTKTRLTLEFA